MKRRGIYLVGILLLLAILIVSCTKIVSKVEEGKSEQYKGISLDKTVNFKEVTYQVSSEWYASEDDEYSNFYCLDIEEPLVSILLCCEKDTQTEELLKAFQEEEDIKILVQEQKKYAGKPCVYLKYEQLEKERSEFVVTEYYLFDHNDDTYAFILFYTEQSEAAMEEGEQFKAILETLVFEESQMESNDPYGLGVSYYEEGQYKVGMDIPAGKYVAWCIDSRYGGYFCVSSDANQDDILFNEIFDVNSLLEIREGEYVEASRCLLIPMDEFYAEYTIKTDITGTMLRVGYDIQAGEYKLQAEEGESGYYCIYGELRQEDILANDIFEKTTYVTIKEGQYLILHDCTIVQ